ncbi:MAG: amidohydrolase family protein [Gemmatimonadales bacterium]
MLIDVHGHFHTERSGRADWQVLNERRLATCERVGVTGIVASVLGSYGARSPTYFPSVDDVEHANSWMADFARSHRGVRGYCLVNPNYTEHAVKEIERRVREGMIGIKLAASRRANDALLDPIAELATERRVPILHHVWQHRRTEWPGQEASDAAELAELASRHEGARIILAHLGGGGDWAHSLRVLEERPNVWVDLSGSGVDPDMLEQAVEWLGADRLLWGTDLTVDTAWGKLRYLEGLGLGEEVLQAIRFGNASAVFPAGAFDGD